MRKGNGIWTSDKVSQVCIEMIAWSWFLKGCKNNTRNSSVLCRVNLESRYVLFTASVHSLTNVIRFPSVSLYFNHFKHHKNVKELLQLVMDHWLLTEVTSNHVKLLLRQTLCILARGPTRGMFSSLVPSNISRPQLLGWRSQWNKEMLDLTRNTYQYTWKCILVSYTYS